MVRAPSFAGVILAAGESSRMGTDKGLLPWPPVVSGGLPAGTFLSAAIQSLFSTDIVLVVAGNNAAALAPTVFANGAAMVVNPDPSRGQFSSMQVGLREVLNRGRDAAMITLVDRPPVGRDTIQQLRDAFQATPDHIWAVVPEFGGRHGHPILAGRELIEVFLQASPVSTARDVERGYQNHIEYVRVNDPHVAMNINTPEEYSELAAKSSI
jgi:molybdenum cofactor cytidylyltransferase